MAPARCLLFQPRNGYGGCIVDPQYALHSQKAVLIPALMAEEGNGSSRKRKAEDEGGKEQEAGAGPSTTTAKESEHETHEEWLQLSIGSPAGTRRGAAATLVRGASVELQLFPDRPPPTAAEAPALLPPLAMGTTGWRPVSSVSAAGSGLVGPPQRPRFGIWVALRPAVNQVKEPFLPQLQKSYLRIKDGSMPVRLLMRYLAEKLGLQDESEVEITCREQKLVPFATLEDVRDQLWCTREAEAPAPGSPAADYVMKLFYSRS
ncbi:hypothetical protein HPP92_011746 [Vanilla planifolia]|uniref:Uncharacterized protein n=1 Tax=Vanilla planifolia TaxID=51239 RepID=A0A835R6N2_VANPL|nr:hypothetical protein HPP92_011746 [Vanilla planifolia]